MQKTFNLLYLYIFFQDNPRQADTPPTSTDISCIASGVLQVYRWYGGAYEHLKVENEKVVWEKVETAEIYNDAEEEIGEYHA